MENQLRLLKEKFYKIKSEGWIKSCRQDCGGIGMTFEKLLGIEPNEFEIPDFGEIELKTKTDYSEKYITLFNCVPTGPHVHEVERLKDLYGYPDTKLNQYKVLYSVISSNKLTKIGKKFQFKLLIDEKINKIFLLVYDLKGSLLENIVYWDFDILEEKLYRKLKYLAIINAKKSYRHNQKYFYYHKMRVYRLKNFKSFIDLIKLGDIKIGIKLGIYRSGNRIGKIHDRGVGFTINEESLTNLFNLVETI